MQITQTLQSKSITKLPELIRKINQKLVSGNDPVDHQEYYKNALKKIAQFCGIENCWLTTGNSFYNMVRDDTFPKLIYIFNDLVEAIGPFKNTEIPFLIKNALLSINSFADLESFFDTNELISYEIPELTNRMNKPSAREHMICDYYTSKYTQFYKDHMTKTEKQMQYSFT
jgi:hypothetical protein